MTPRRKCNILSNAGGGVRPTSHVTKLPPRQNKTYGSYRPMTSYTCTCHWWRSASDMVLLPLMWIPPLKKFVEKFMAYCSLSP